MLLTFLGRCNEGREPVIIIGAPPASWSVIENWKSCANLGSIAVGIPGLRKLGSEKAMFTYSDTKRAASMMLP